MNTQDFLALFKDPIFVAIPNKGGDVLHTKHIEKVLARNVEGIFNGAYFTVNGFANFVEGSKSGRKITDVTSFNCNYLDIDLTPETKRTEAEAIYKELCVNNLKPTAIVLTGKGLHIYWNYKTPHGFSEEKAKEYKALQNAIVTHYESRGGDRAATDAPRVLRIPGCNYYNDDNVKTCEIELLYLNPESKYDPIEIASYFRNTITIDTQEGMGLMRLMGDGYDLISALNVKHGSMHRDSYSAALSLIQKSRDLASARDLYRVLLSTWEQPLDWDKCWKQFENAKAFVEKDRPQLFITDSSDQKIGVSIASDITMKRIEWLWPGFIAKGKPHILTGDPGLAKSQITVDIAARLSRGAVFPSYTIGEKPYEPVGVIILSAEDDAADTIVPRLSAAGADLTRVAFLSSSIVAVDKNKRTKIRSLALREDAEKILTAIATLPFKVGMIVIDPISAFLSGTQDANSNSDARGTLAELQHAVMDKGIAMLIINHTNKNTNAKSAHMRSMGSVGWNAAARATFYVFRDEDPERRVFSIGKMNLAKENGHGFFYRVKERAVEIEGAPTMMPYIEWDDKEFPNQSADAYVQNGDGKKESKVDECKTELDMHMVKVMSSPSKEVMAHMKERGYSNMVIYRAARELGLMDHDEYGIWKKQ